MNDTAKSMEGAIHSSELQLRKGNRALPHANEYLLPIIVKGVRLVPTIVKTSDGAVYISYTREPYEGREIPPNSVTDRDPRTTSLYSFHIRS